MQRLAGLGRGAGAGEAAAAAAAARPCRPMSVMVAIATRASPWQRSPDNA